MLTRRQSEADRIRARYGERLVAAPPDLAPATEEVDVESMAALAALADQCEGPILHLADPWTGAEVYFVDDGGQRYRYRVEGRPVPPGRRVTL